MTRAEKVTELAADIAQALELAHRADALHAYLVSEAAIRAELARCQVELTHATAILENLIGEDDT